MQQQVTTCNSDFPFDFWTGFWLLQVVAPVYVSVVTLNLSNQDNNLGNQRLMFCHNNSHNKIIVLPNQQSLKVWVMIVNLKAFPVDHLEKSANWAIMKGHMIMISLLRHLRLQISKYSTEFYIRFKQDWHQGTLFIVRGDKSKIGGPGAEPLSPLKLVAF